jgi:hypothetical protein
MAARPLARISADGVTVHSMGIQIYRDKPLSVCSTALVTWEF